MGTKRVLVPKSPGNGGKPLQGRHASDVMEMGANPCTRRVCAHLDVTTLDQVVKVRVLAPQPSLSPAQHPFEFRIRKRKEAGGNVGTLSVRLPYRGPGRSPWPWKAAPSLSAAVAGTASRRTFCSAADSDPGACRGRTRVDLLSKLITPPRAPRFGLTSFPLHLQQNRSRGGEARAASRASSASVYGMSGIRSTLIRVAVIVARSPPATRLPLGSNRSEIATAV